MFQRRFGTHSLLFLLICLLFQASPATSAGITDIFKNLIMKNDKNYVYDIIHYDIQATQKPDSLDVTTRMKFKMTGGTNDKFAFYMATGCALQSVNDVLTGKTIPFEIKTELLVNGIFFNSGSVNESEQDWEFKYTCGAQNIFSEDIAWFGPEGVQIGMIAWYPSNILDGAFTYNLNVKTLDGFVAASNGKLDSDYGKNNYHYTGESNQIYLFIKNYKIVKKEKGGITYLFFIGSGVTPKIGYDRIVDIADYVLDLYSSLFAPYGRENFTIAETVKPGGRSNWGLGDTIFIMPEFWENDEADYLFIIGHEAGHTWYGKLLFNDMRGLAGFVETLANTCQTIAEERNPFVTLGSETAMIWSSAYSEYVKELDTKRLKEISILKTKYNLPGTAIQHYIKGAMILRMFRYKFGDDSFFKIMKEFTQMNQNAPCSFERFVETAREIAGNDAAEFLLRWFGGTKRMDYALTKVVETKNNGKYKTSVTIENKGEESLGAPIEVSFSMKKNEDKTDDIVKVNLTEPTTSYEYESDNEVVSVAIDPHNWLVDSVWNNDWINWEDIERK